MSKAVLEFSLPEEQAEFEQACAAASYQAALSEFREWLRAERKYKEAPPWADTAWEKFFEIMNEYGIAEHV